MATMRLVPWRANFTMSVTTAPKHMLPRQSITCTRPGRGPLSSHTSPDTTIYGIGHMYISTHIGYTTWNLPARRDGVSDSSGSLARVFQTSSMGSWNASGLPACFTTHNHLPYCITGHGFVPAAPGGSRHPAGHDVVRHYPFFSEIAVLAVEGLVGPHSLSLLV